MKSKSISRDQQGSKLSEYVSTANMKTDQRANYSLK
jgi:hypothetical protein